MTRTLVRGGAIALTFFLVALIGDTIGLDTLWPLVLAAAVGLAAGHDRLGRFGSFVVGAGLGWVAFAVRAGFLPDTAASRGISLLVAAVGVTLVAAATAERLPLWAGLAGVAGFLGLYGPIYAESPTAFLSESPSALVSIVLAAAIAAIAVTITDLFAHDEARAEHIVLPNEPASRTRIPDEEEEVRS